MLIQHGAAADDRFRVPVAEDPWPAPYQAWAIVALLVFANCMATLDRAILALLVDPVKASLELTDTSIGVLQSSFGIFLTAATFPAGWLADKFSRVRLIGIAISFWSFATMLCGLAVNFIQLFLARMGVAFGEAALMPAGPSLISDNFPPDRRTMPLAIYGGGAAAGMSVSLMAGGIVTSLVAASGTFSIPFFGALEPWQIVFVAIGLPGIFVTLLFFFVPEPVRRERAEPHGTTRDLIELLKLRRTIIVPHFTGMCLYFIHVYAYFAWAPAFLMRVYGWSVPETGLRYGGLMLAANVVGVLSGGGLARRLWRRDRADANLLAATTFLALLSIPSVLAPLVSNIAAGLALFLMMSICSIATAGPSVASIQEIVPNRLRGRVTAIYFALIGVVGATLGPLIVGLMTDHLFVGSQHVGKSLALISLLTVPLGCLLVYFASRRRRGTVI